MYGKIKADSGLFVALWFGLFLASCGSNQAVPTMGDGRSVYESEHGEIFDLYDFRVMVGTVALPSEVDGQQYYLTDIGGPLEDCSNDEFYCLKGGILAVLPKGAIPRVYSHAGLECRRTDSIWPFDAISIKCSHNYNETEFTLGDHGIEEYRTAEKGMKGERYLLVSEVGIFGDGWSAP